MVGRLLKSQTHYYPVGESRLNIFLVHHQHTLLKTLETIDGGIPPVGRNMETGLGLRSLPRFRLHA